MRETSDFRDKLSIARAIGDYRQGRISRRTMLKALAAAGVALGASPARGRRAWAAPSRQELTADQQPEEINAFLKDVGGQFSGASIKVVSEETPPSRAIINLKKALFEDLTGITVNWEVVPLDQVLAKVSQDAATQSGANDIYYFDQAWVGRFINDTFDPARVVDRKARPGDAELQHRRLSRTAGSPHRNLRRQDDRLPLRRADLHVLLSPGHL